MRGEQAIGTTRHQGIAFGPAFQEQGSQVQFEVSDRGLRLVGAGGGSVAPLWRDIEVKDHGFNAGQLMLAWTGRDGKYALMVSAAASQAAVRAAAPGSSMASGGADTATRLWSASLILVLFVGPLAALLLFLWQSDNFADWVASRIPIETERKLGATAFAKAKSQLKLVDKPGVTRVLNEIGGRLTAGSVYRYEFHLVDDPSVNAFAMPGGFVVVHTGLIAQARSAEEVAGVLAHEVQHVERRHSLKSMVRAAGLSVMIAIVFGDASGGIVASMAENLTALKFSRGQESEADLLGLEALQRAGIDPAGMRSFFKRMADDEKLALSMLSSHPASAERFAAIDAALRPGVSYRPLPYDWAAVRAGLK